MGRDRHEYLAKYYQENKSKIQAYHYTWSRVNREKLKAYHAANWAANGKEIHLRCRYKLSMDDYGAMLDKQDGLCAVCKERPAKCVDHDHTSGRVRGLVCYRCNTRLSALDDTDWVELAKEYLKEVIRGDKVV